MCEFMKPNGKQCLNAKGKPYCHIKSHQPAEKPVVEKKVDEPVAESECSTIDSSEDDVEVVEVAEVDVENDEEMEIFGESISAEYDTKKSILTFREYVAAWRSSGKDIDHDSLGDASHSTCLYIENTRDDEIIESVVLYFKSNEDLESFQQVRREVKPLQYCMENELYDHRLYKLCCIIKKSWFSDTNNLWNLAGMLYQKQHVDLDLMRKTYVCILRTMTDRLNVQTALGVFNEWEDSKYHPKLNESQLKSMAGGNDSKTYNEWKDEYEPKEIKVEKSTKKADKETLRDLLIAKLNGEYRRSYETGIIWKRKFNYYYECVATDANKFLNTILKGEVLWMDVSKGKRHDLLDFIKYVDHTGFEFLEVNYDYIGYTNGVYDLTIAEFIPAENFDRSIQVRKFFSYDFELKDSTPLLDKYFATQFTDESSDDIAECKAETERNIEMIYFAVGRCLTRLDDKFDFVIFLHGLGGVGKSILQGLTKHSHDYSDIGLFGASYQDGFGGSVLANSQLIISDELPNDLPKKLPKSDFLCMASRGPVSCPIKGVNQPKLVHDWNIPSMFNSNSLPNYSDVAGEVLRRILVIHFGNDINEKDKDLELESKIKEQEYCNFLHRARSTYLRYKKEYRGVDFHVFMPRMFHESSTMLREAINNSYQFAMEHLEYVEGNEMSKQELTYKFKEYLQARFKSSTLPKEALDMKNVLLTNEKFKFERQNLCKFCRKKHQKNCCDAYTRNGRTTGDKYINVCFVQHKY